MLEIKHLRKEYPNAVPLKDVSVTINKGDVISIIGPSGTGKSTLIRCINQLDTPTSGEIIFEGKDITKAENFNKETKLKIGMVFQQYCLFSHMNVIENVMYSLVKNKGYKEIDAYNKSLEFLKKVGMAEKCFNYPDQLSGGQKQRVAIARTLAMEPELILLDEPTSALDPANVGEVENVLLSLAEAGHTMMIVTHSLALAKRVSNRIFYMDEGGIYEDGKPSEIFVHPKKEKTKKFISENKTLSIEILSVNHDRIKSINDINNFRFLYDIREEVTRCAQMIFEELCLEILLPQLKDNPKILFELTITRTGLGIVSVKYNGDRFNYHNSENKLPLHLIEAVFKEYGVLEEYKEIDEDGYTNYLTFGRHVAFKDA